MRRRDPIELLAEVLDYLFPEEIPPGEPRAVTMLRKAAAVVLLVGGFVVAAPVVIVCRYVKDLWQ